MRYKELIIRSESADTITTELMYEIASGRADSVDLIKMYINNDNPDKKRIISKSIRTLRDMKQKGSIQFFATEDSFERMSTEAVFLINKFPDYFSSYEKDENKSIIFVKI